MPPFGSHWLVRCDSSETNNMIKMGRNKTDMIRSRLAIHIHFFHRRWFPNFISIRHHPILRSILYDTQFDPIRYCWAAHGRCITACAVLLRRARNGETFWSFSQALAPNWEKLTTSLFWGPKMTRNGNKMLLKKEHNIMCHHVMYES